MIKPEHPAWTLTLFHIEMRRLFDTSLPCSRSNFYLGQTRQVREARNWNFNLNGKTFLIP